MDMCIETSVNELHRSAVEAFPSTTRRQHSTHTVRIEHLDWIPFEGVGTMMVRGLANNEGRKNRAIVLFKGVKYESKEGRGVVPVMSSSGKVVHMRLLSPDENDVMVRCTCPDFRWRFAHWDKVGKSLFGRGPGRYEAVARPGSANPDGAEGMCKHLMKMVKIIEISGAFDDRLSKFRRKNTT